MMFIYLVGIVGYLGGVAGGCPDEETTLVPFSQTDHTMGLTISSNLTITGPVLLDMNLNVNYILITGAQGRLVFKEQHIYIRTQGIFIKDYGQLIIGSESCPFQHNVNIVLKGERDLNNLLDSNAGEKFISVTQNGELQIHGKDKLAWTKLTETIHRFADVNNTNGGADVKYDHKNSAKIKTNTWQKGLTLYVFNSSLVNTFFSAYDFYNTPQAERAQVNNMIADLAKVAVGDLVAISLQDFFNPKNTTNFSVLWSKIEQLAGMPNNMLLMRNSTKFDAFSLVFVANASIANFNQKQDILISKLTTLATASIEYQGWKVSAESRITMDKPLESEIDLRIMSKNVGYPVIKALADITSWEVGDEVLLTSTDYSYDHGEVRTILQKVDNHTLKLSGELFYRHFGEIEDRVDMRGEVALLTRNIKISGEMSRGCPQANENCAKTNFDTHGGHIKIFYDFSAVVIKGAELKHMGMATDKGHYPIHFHLCGNATGKTAIVKENSIHNTFSRAVTVHGTYGVSKENPGVKVINNVAYDIFGHAYFLEDGVEVATVLQGNLGAHIKNIDNAFNFTADNGKATVFWITNPETIMIGNVAAGSQGMGIAYSFPDHPVGPAAGMPVYKLTQARHTPMWQFENNVVHSCEKGGMNFEDKLKDDNGNLQGSMTYDPLENPLILTSAPVRIQLTRLTAYKNRDFNCFLRGGWFEMMQYSSAESRRGIQLARGGQRQQFVKKSIFIGRSKRNFEGKEYPDAPSKSQLPHYVGVMWYDGPAFISKSWFQGFQPGADHAWEAGALSFQPHNLASSSVTSTATDLRFGFSDVDGGNRVYYDSNMTDDSNLSPFDGSESPTMRDGDGSVTQCVGTDPKYAVQVVNPEKILLTEGCRYRDNWKMAVCPNLYGKIKVHIEDVFTGTIMDFNKAGLIRRVEYADNTKVAYKNQTGNQSPENMVILGDLTHRYDLQFTDAFPQKATFEGIGVESGLPVVVGICLPANAVHSTDYKLSSAAPNDVKWMDGSFIFVRNFNELRADTSLRRVYLVGRMLYIKLQNKIVRNTVWDAHDSDHCSGDFCPTFTIELLNTSLPYTPCFTPTTAELNAVMDTATLPKHNCTLSAKDPDLDWGTGDVLQAHDGNWGEFGSWCYCCRAGDGSTKKITRRRRLCDNPPPSVVGAACAGNSEETRHCLDDVGGTSTNTPLLTTTLLSLLLVFFIATI